jgi:hypothetical protein
MVDQINIITIQTGERTAVASVGQTVLHFNPSTGRQVRQVTIIEVVSEDCATVEVFTGRDKGRRYPLAANKMAA